MRIATVWQIAILLQSGYNGGDVARLGQGCIGYSSIDRHLLGFGIPQSQSCMLCINRTLCVCVCVCVYVLVGLTQ
jgi:hypothetical protein